MSTAPSLSNVPPRSDWAILNSTSPGQLRHILATVHACTETEIQQACYLLESYHAVYRENLMQLRAQAYRGQCPSPTLLQLQQIAQHLQSKTEQSYSPQQVMYELQIIAQKRRCHFNINSVNPNQSLTLTLP